MASTVPARPSVWDKLKDCNELKLMIFEHVYAGKKLMHQTPGQIVVHEGVTGKELSEILGTIVIDTVSAPFLVSKSFAHPSQLLIAIASSAASVKLDNIEHWIGLGNHYKAALAKLRHLTLVPDPESECSKSLRASIFLHCPRLRRLELAYEKLPLYDCYHRAHLADVERLDGLRQQGLLVVQSEREEAELACRIMFDALLVRPAEKSIRYWLCPLLRETKPKDIEVLLSLKAKFEDDSKIGGTVWTMSSKDWLLKALYGNKEYAFFQLALKEDLERYEHMRRAALARKK